MSPPFRHVPPDAPAFALTRPRLLAELLHRWDTPLVVLAAGAGFGKTTLLTQAMDENRLAPRGRDIWLSCDADDCNGARLLDGLARALDRAGLPTTGQQVEDIAAALATASPTRVALLLDDLHEVDAASSGADALAALLRIAPANASFVLAARDLPPVPVARAAAQRRVLELGGDELRFTAGELALLRERLAIEERLDATGGWPALVSLAATGGRIDAAQFVVEEVLPGLTPDARMALSIVVAVGQADRDLVEHLTGRRLDPVELLRTVPLVHIEGTTAVAHDLWHDVRTVVIEADDAARWRARAGAWHLGRGNDETAFELVVDDDASVLGVLRRAVLPGSRTSVNTLRSWLGRVAPAVRDSPPGLLAQATVLRAEDPGSAHLIDLLERVVHDCRLTGDRALETAALAHQGFVANLHRDPGHLFAVLGRVDELVAEGVAEAQPLQALGRAVVANAAQDAPAVVAAVRAIPSGALDRDLGAAADFFLANALIDLGDPSAIGPARRCVDAEPLLPGMADVEFRTRFLIGDLDGLLDVDVPGLEPGAPVRNQFLASLFASVCHAALGRGERARRLAHRAEQLAGDLDVAPTNHNIQMMWATVAYFDGEADDARQRFRSLVDEFPLDGRLAPRLRPAIVPLYLLVPEARPGVEELAVGPLWHEALELARCLLAIDEGRDVGPMLSGLRWPSPGRCVAAAGVTGAARLAAAGRAARAGPGADALTEWLFDRLPDGTLAALHGEGSRHAHELLASVPARPVERRDLRLLGPTELLIGGRPVEGADWRREPVRLLVSFLVTHPDTTRDKAIAALWPDVSPETGRRRLRSVLNRLISVLEPERRSGDAPYFIRSTGSRLQLWTMGPLDIDVYRLEEAVTETRAAEETGAPSLAIEHGLRALDLWRGDPLADAADAAWARPVQERLRSLLVGTGNRTAELLVAADRTDEAVRVAARVLEVDPWSERAHRATAAAYLAADERSAARRAFETLRKAMTDLGCEPDEESLMLERQLEGRTAG